MQRTDVSNLLINEPPIAFLPSLAVRVGVDEAIFLQQLHYWLERSSNVEDGERWVYNTYGGWAEEFPFWSEATVRRIIDKLKKLDLLITSSAFNKFPGDRTTWYRINYERLSGLSHLTESADHLLKMSRPSAQNGQIPSAQNGQTNTRELLESTSKESASPPTDQAEGEKELPGYADPGVFLGAPEKRRAGKAATLEADKELREWFDFWFEDYPNQSRPEEAWKAFRRLAASEGITPEKMTQLQRSVALWKESEQWQEERFIPRAENFLGKGTWKEEPKGRAA